MPVEGRGLSWKETQEATKTEGLVSNLTTPASVQKLQTGLHDKAKESPSFRFHALYDKVYRKDVLAFAYWCGKANGGAAGVDNQTFEDIETYGVEGWLDRRDRSALDAVRHVHKLINTGHVEIVDADLSSYFDTLPHSGLLKSVARRVADGAMLHLIKMWLEAPVEETDERGNKRRSTRNRDEGRGTPQGSPI